LFWVLHVASPFSIQIHPVLPGRTRDTQEICHPAMVNLGNTAVA
jgi:hypothetical protein